MPATINHFIAVTNSWGAAFVGIARPMMVQSVLVMLTLLILVWACRRVRAVLRYALLMLVLLKLLLPPSLSLPTGLAYWWPVTKSAVPDSPRVQRFSIVRHESRARPAAVKFTAPAVVLLVWLAGLAALLAFVLARYRRLSRLDKLAPPADLQELANSCRRELGLRRDFPLRISTGCASPAVCGLLRPVMVMPRALVDRLSLSQLRQVLLHELIHVKRHDLWVNHLQALLQILYWYNPLLWLANAVIRRTREEAVDETVTVALGQGADSYAETLLAVAKLSIAQPSLSLGFIGIVEPKTALKQRLAKLIQQPVPKTAKVGWINSGMILLLGGILLPMAHPESRIDRAPPKPGVVGIDTGQIPGAAKRPADVTVTEDQIDQELAREMQKAGSRRSFVESLQAQGLTLEQFRQKLRDRLAQRETPNSNRDTVLVNSRPGSDPEGSNTVAKIVIRHVGVQAVLDERIKSKISVKVGAPVAPADVDADVRRLYATGLFFNVRVVQEKSPGGTILTYIVQEKPRLEKIEFEGNTKLIDEGVREKLASRVGDPLDERKLFEDAQTIQGIYQRHGYPDVRVQYKMSNDEEAGYSRVTFEIESKSVGVVNPTSSSFWTFDGNAKQGSPPLALSLDGSMMAKVRLWNAATGKEIVTTEEQSNTTRRVTFSPGGKRLAVMDGNRRSAWEVVPGGARLSTNLFGNTPAKAIQTKTGIMSDPQFHAPSTATGIKDDSQFRK